MGFKDGTNNLAPARPGSDENVWVTGADEPAWMGGGSYLVVRRIRMLIEAWDRSTLADQEHTIGRHEARGRAVRACPRVRRPRPRGTLRGEP